MAEPIHVYGFEGSPNVEIVWTHEDQERALAEGWFLDEMDGGLQADHDHPAFDRDNQAAYAHVRTLAGKGSELHQRAMIFELWAALSTWEQRHRETVGKDRDDV